jgi:hypothetical protein
MSKILVLDGFFHQNTSSDDGTDDFATTVDADVLAIPVTHAYVAKTLGADAEALTLADGTVFGQLLTINIATDGGGAGTLTPTTASGWATIVFDEAKDQAVLMWTGPVGGWRIWSLTGTAGPPVHT